jgi:tripartite ATP-independent transporter DctP family solute receptor
MLHIFQRMSAIAAVAAVAAGLSASAYAQAGGSGKTVNIRFGNHYETSHPNNACGAQQMMQALNANNAAGIKMAVFPAAQLGTAPQMVEQLAIGELEMAMASPADLGAWYEPMSVMDAAYAFDNFGQVTAFVESGPGKKLYEEVLKKTRVRIIGTWLYGTRHLTANKPVRTPEDLKGLKVRAPNAPVMLANVAAMGGRATPMAFGEVYLGLQQRVIDAQENPLPTIKSMKFNEVQEYLMLTGHVVATTQILVSESFWQSLNQAQRDAIMATVDTATKSVRKCIEDQEQEILAAWKSGKGMKVVSDVDGQKFRASALKHFSDRSKFSWADLYANLRKNP